MAALRRPLTMSLAVIVTMLLLALLAFALGADAVSLVLGAAIVAAGVAFVVGAWLLPARRLRRRERRTRRQDERKARGRAQRTRRAVNEAEKRLYGQLEALMWLRDMLQLEKPLAPTRGAAAAPDALLELVRIVDAGARNVLELGSGTSTIVVARRLQQAGGGRIVSLEHMPEYAALTRAQIATHGLEGFAVVMDAPLVDVEVDGERRRWYQLGTDVPAGVDALFIDGPPAGTGSLARYPALPLLGDHLAPGATVFVDDGDRPEEREMVRRW
ncbi:MAG: class I SAM-dependent methyltransferase, partial [Chloroflexota bacterium]|nr:class I SAM-dependent methyltransferase [Chloroflexota bacterium]